VDRQDGRQVVRLERGRGQTTIYEVESLPEGRQDVAQEYVHHLDTGDPLHPSLGLWFNVDVMAILDAGVRSAASAKLETVDNATWRIG
jgi:hypothetical protein